MKLFNFHEKKKFTFACSCQVTFHTGFSYSEHLTRDLWIESFWMMKEGNKSLKEEPIYIYVKKNSLGQMDIDVLFSAYFVLIMVNTV